MEAAVAKKPRRNIRKKAFFICGDRLDVDHSLWSRSHQQAAVTIDVGEPLWPGWMKTFKIQIQSVRRVGTTTGSLSFQILGIGESHQHVKCKVSLLVKKEDVLGLKGKGTFTLL
jgi:hypothetical protein